MPPRRQPRNSHLLQHVQIGDEIEVWWPDDHTYYPGRVDRVMPNNRHRIVYNDGEVEVLRLDTEQWRFQGEAAERVQALTNNRTLRMEASSSDPRQRVEPVAFSAGQSAASGSRRSSGPPATAAVPKRAKGRIRRASSPAPAAVSSTSSSRLRSRGVSSSVQNRKEKDTASSHTISKQSAASPSSPRTKSSSAGSSSSRKGSQSQSVAQRIVDNPSPSVSHDNQNEKDERESASSHDNVVPQDPKLKSTASSSVFPIAKPSLPAPTQNSATQAMATQATPVPSVPNAACANSAPLNVTSSNSAPSNSAPSNAAPSSSAPTNSAPTNSAPTNSAPTQAAPTQAAPTQAAPTQAAPTQAAPTQAAPTQAAPTQAAPTQAAPTQAAPTKAAPSKTAPSKTAPSKSAPSKSASSNSAASKSATRPVPAKSSLVKSASAKSASAKSASAKSASTKSAPAKLAPAKSALTNTAPTDVAPTNTITNITINATPPNAAPMSATLTNSSSTNTGPMNTGPTNAAPANAASTNAASTNAAPANAAPANAAPANAAPANAALANAALANAAPANAAPANAAPANSAPANSAPLNASAVNTAAVSTVPVNFTPKSAAPMNAIANNPPTNPGLFNPVPTNNAPTKGASAHFASTQATTTSAAFTQAEPILSAPSKVKSLQAMPNEVMYKRVVRSPTPKPTPTFAPKPTPTLSSNPTPTQAVPLPGRSLQVRPHVNSSPTKRPSANQSVMVDNQSAVLSNTRVPANPSTFSDRRKHEPQKSLDKMETVNLPAEIDMRQAPTMLQPNRSNTSPKLEASRPKHQSERGPLFFKSTPNGRFSENRAYSEIEHNNISPQVSNSHLSNAPSSKNTPLRQNILHVQERFRANVPRETTDQTRGSVAREPSDSIEPRNDLPFQKALSVADPGKLNKIQPPGNMHQSAISEAQVVSRELNHLNSHVNPESNVSMPMEGSTNSNNVSKPKIASTSSFQPPFRQTTNSETQRAYHVQQLNPALVTGQNSDHLLVAGSIQHPQCSSLMRNGMEPLETLANASLADHLGSEPSEPMAISSLMSSNRSLDCHDTDSKRLITNPPENTVNITQKKASDVVIKTTTPEQRECVNIAPSVPIVSQPSSDRPSRNMVSKLPSQYEIYSPSVFAVAPNIGSDGQGLGSHIHSLPHGAVNSEGMISGSMPQSSHNNMVNRSNPVENSTNQASLTGQDVAGSKTVAVISHAVGLNPSSLKSSGPFQPRSRTIRPERESIAPPVPEALQSADPNNIVFTSGVNSLKVYDKRNGSFAQTSICEAGLNQASDEQNNPNLNHPVSTISPRMQAARQLPQTAKPYMPIAAPHLPIDVEAMRGNISSASHFPTASAVGMSAVPGSKIMSQQHHVPNATTGGLVRAQEAQCNVDAANQSGTVVGSNPKMIPSEEPFRETVVMSSHGMTPKQPSPSISNVFQNSTDHNSFTPMRSSGSSAGTSLVPNTDDVRISGQVIPAQRTFQESTAISPGGHYSINTSTGIQQSPIMEQQAIDKGVEEISFSADDVPLVSGQGLLLAHNSAIANRNSVPLKNNAAVRNSPQTQHVVHMQANRDNLFGKAITAPKASWHVTRTGSSAVPVAEASPIHGQIPSQAKPAQPGRSPNSTKAVSNMKLASSSPLPPDAKSNSAVRTKNIPISAGATQLHSSSQPVKAISSARMSGEVVPSGPIPRGVIASMASGPPNTRRFAVDPRIRNSENAGGVTAEKSVSFSNPASSHSGDAKRRLDHEPDSASKRRRLGNNLSNAVPKAIESETRRVVTSPKGSNTVPFEKTVEAKGNIIGIRPKSTGNEGVLKRPRGQSLGEVRGKANIVSRSAPICNTNPETSQFDAQRSGAVKVVERNNCPVPIQTPSAKVSSSLSRGRSNPNVTQNVEKGTASLPLNILMKTITDSNEQVLKLKMEPLTQKLDDYFSTNQDRINMMLQKLESLLATSGNHVTPEGVRFELTLPKQQLNALLDGQQYLREVLSRLITGNETEQIRIKGLIDVESKVDKLESRMDVQFRELNVHVNGMKQNFTEFGDFSKSLSREVEQLKNSLGMHENNLRKEMEQQRSLFLTEVRKLEGIEERIMKNMKSNMLTIFEEMQKESAATVARAIQQTFQVQENFGNISTSDGNGNDDPEDPKKDSDEPCDNNQEVDDNEYAEVSGESTQNANSNNVQNDSNAGKEKPSTCDIAITPKEASLRSEETRPHVPSSSKNGHEEKIVNDKDGDDNENIGVTDSGANSDAFLAKAATAATVAAAVAAGVASSDISDTNVDVTVKSKPDIAESTDVEKDKAVKSEGDGEDTEKVEQVDLKGQSDKMLGDQSNPVSSEKELGPAESRKQLDKSGCTEMEIDCISKEERDTNALLDGVIRQDTRELLGRAVVRWLLYSGCRSHPPKGQVMKKSLLSEWYKESVERCLNEVLTGLLKYKKAEDAKNSLDDQLRSQTKTVQLDWIIKGPTQANISKARYNYSQWEPPLLDYEWNLDRVVLTKVAVGLLQAEKKVLQSWLKKSLDVLEIAKDVVQVGLSNFNGASA